VVVRQTLANEFFAAVRDGRLWWELDLARVEDCLVPHDGHLRFVVAERLDPEEQLVKNHAHTPNINLLSDLRILALIEALWRLVPVGADALTRQFDFVLIFLDNFAQAEVGDLDLAIVEDDILRLKVIMDNLLLLVVEVLEAGQNLGNYELGLLLLYLLIFFQVVVEIGPTAQL